MSQENHPKPLKVLWEQLLGADVSHLQGCFAENEENKALFHGLPHILTDCAVESELCSNSSVPPFGALLRKRAVGAADMSVGQTASWAAASWITETVRASGAELQRPLKAPCDNACKQASARNEKQSSARRIDTNGPLFGGVCSRAL